MFYQRLVLCGFALISIGFSSSISHALTLANHSKQDFEVTLSSEVTGKATRQIAPEQQLSHLDFFEWIQTEKMPKSFTLQVRAGDSAFSSIPSVNPSVHIGLYDPLNEDPVSGEISSNTGNTWKDWAIAGATNLFYWNGFVALSAYGMFIGVEQGAAIGSQVGTHLAEKLITSHCHPYIVPLIAPAALNVGRAAGVMAGQTVGAAAAGLLTPVLAGLVYQTLSSAARYGYWKFYGEDQEKRKNWLKSLKLIKPDVFTVEEIEDGFLVLNPQSATSSCDIKKIPTQIKP